MIAWLHNTGLDYELIVTTVLHFPGRTVFLVQVGNEYCIEFYNSEVEFEHVKFVKYKFFGLDLISLYLSK